MRVSIWQQWASNHSANFTVAGRFATVEAAEKAADELRQIVVEIAQWYDVPENRRVFEDFTTPFHPPSPPELKFAERYNIKWEHAVDWLQNPDNAANRISVFENTVFISSHWDQSDVGPAPFDQIMGQLGGNVTTEFEGVSAIEVTLVCRAPDEMAAEALFQECDAYLSRRTTTPPWSISTRGTIVRTGILLMFRKLDFGEVEFGLPALIAYLKGVGCTEITYELSS